MRVTEHRLVLYSTAIITHNKYSPENWQYYGIITAVRYTASAKGLCVNIKVQTSIVAVSPYFED